MKVYFIASGIYIWEYFSNLDYEWSVIRGRQRYRWTIWIYSVARFCTLTAVALVLANFSIMTKINCQAWLLFGWSAVTVGCYGLGSILVMLRIFAIWNKDKNIMAISFIVWIANLAFQFSAIPKFHSTWVPTVRACADVSFDTIRTHGACALVSDATLLLIMLAGLLRLRHRDRGFINIASFLWKQGVIWLFIATAAQLPQVVALYVDSNESFDSLFLFPPLIILMIAATRMYRDLTQYSPTPPTLGGLDSSKLANSNRLVSSSKDSTAIVHIPSNRLEVTVHKAYEEYPMSQMGRYGSHPGSDAQLTDKTPAGLCLGDNVEGQDEKE